MAVVLNLIVILGVVTLAACVHGKYLETTNTTSVENMSEREGKFFPFFTVVKFRNGVCAANNNFNGTCFTRKECSTQGGTAGGTCAKNIGVCCVFQRTCGSNTNVNNTYFISPGYPASYAGGSRCTIAINRCSSDICQLRLRFLDVQLAQPDGDGNCNTDALTVSGGASQVPRVCGDLTGQHVYVDFNGDSSVTISIDTDPNVAFDRRWNIRIEQLGCDCGTLAPSGCLMHYTGVSGSVESFNYGTMTNPTLNSMGAVGTRQIANLNYGICVRMEAGYCNITWSQTAGDNLSFTVTGDVTVTDPTILGTGAAQSTNGMCTTDFIVIPDPYQNNMAVNSDRFCGLGLFPTTTSSKPFVLTVVTDGNENDDIANRGFSLQYRQTLCSRFRFAR